MNITKSELVILILGIILLVPGIWEETGITIKDEYWVSFRSPLQMLERGDFFTPWFDGEMRTKKPPLSYWVILSGYRVFGISLFSARIYSVLAGAFLALTICLTYRELFDKSGVAAGLLSLASISVAIEGRQAMLDIPLTCFISLSVYFALRWGKTGYWRHVLLSALSVGLAFLTKGPPVFLFAGAAAVSALFISDCREYALSRWNQLLIAAVFVIIVCAPWPLYMMYHSTEFVETAVDEMFTKRSFGKLSLGAPLSAVWSAIGLVFPWSLLVLVSLFQFMTAKNTDRSARWLVWWYIISLVPFFFMKAFERYLIPTVSCACFLAVLWLETAEQRKRTIFLRFSLGLFCLFIWIAGVFLIWFRLNTALISLCMLGSLFLVWKVKILNLRWVIGSVAGLYAILFGLIYPEIGINKLPEDFENRMLNKRVGVYQTSNPAMLSMRLKRSVERISEEVIRRKNFDGYIFTDDRDRVTGLLEANRVSYEYAGAVRTFYSRVAWIRFTKKGAVKEEWMRALKDRSLEGLKSEVYYFRVYKDEGQGAGVSGQG